MTTCLMLNDSISRTPSIRAVWALPTHLLARCQVVLQHGSGLCMPQSNNSDVAVRADSPSITIVRFPRRTRSPSRARRHRWQGQPPRSAICRLQRCSSKAGEPTWLPGANFHEEQVQAAARCKGCESAMHVAGRSRGGSDTCSIATSPSMQEPESPNMESGPRIQAKRRLPGAQRRSVKHRLPRRPCCKPGRTKRPSVAPAQEQRSKNRSPATLRAVTCRKTGKT